jgi:hypothetical protein
MGQRYFISYRRSAANDNRLAHFLHDRLRAVGHETFIDVGMPVGTDWSAEIDRRIDWCDALVVLLSEHSIQSEMVQGEVRRAHQRRRLDGCPRILPVRVAYHGPLDYELDSYLGRLQYARWEGKDDDEQVLAAILCGEPLALASLSPPGPIAADGARPQPSMDPRTLCQSPGGTLSVDDPFYVRRPADDHIEALAQQIGRTLVIKAPRQMGKSSLLSRYFAACRKQGKVASYIDFQRFDDQSLRDYLTFLAEFADQLLYTLGLDDGEPVPTFPRQQRFIRFVRDRILARIGGPVVFAFDEVDRVLGRPWQGDFFAMLRSWHNDRAVDSEWRKMDLALVIATEPYLLIERPDQSPFNVVTPTELPPFGPAEVAAVNVAYGAPLAPSDLAQLMELLNGHPYLTRLAFFRLSTTAGLTFPALIETAAGDDGPFRDHLRAKLLALQHNAPLLATVKHLIMHRAPPDPDSYWRLHGAGLVARNVIGEVVPANLLYARFLRHLR